MSTIVYNIKKQKKTRNGGITILKITNLKKVQGIYKIKCIRNDKVYIGKSVNIRKRAFEHVRELNKNNHNNQILQNSFNKYGIDFFKFSIIEEVEKEKNLISREVYWIDFFNALDAKKGFNICPAKESQGSSRHIVKTVGVKNGRAKLNTKKVIEICEILNRKEQGEKITLKSIGDRYNVSYKAITHLRDGKNWGNITKNHLNEEIVKKWKTKYKEKWFKFEDSASNQSLFLKKDL